MLLHPLRRVRRLLALAAGGGAIVVSAATTPRSEIRIREPFVLRDDATQTYLIYAAVNATEPGGRSGVIAYRTVDLENWEDPVWVWEIPGGRFWGEKDVYAPKVFRTRGRCYLFVTLTSHQPRLKIDGTYSHTTRGTQILVAEDAMGPFRPFPNGPQTPGLWNCSAGFLYPFFCDPHMMYARDAGDESSVDLIQLDADLSSPVNEASRRFLVSDAPWVRRRPGASTAGGDPTTTAGYVATGLWVHRTKRGLERVLWSSYGSDGCAIGMSWINYTVGRWEHAPEPLWSEDGSGPMLFETFDGRLVMAFHQPDRGPERARFFEMEDLGVTLRLKGEIRLNEASSDGDREVMPES